MIPKDLKYSKDHEWLKIEGEIAIVGITNFAQEELGDIVFVDVDTEGETLEKEEVFGSIEAVKTVSDLYAPVSGTVIAVNEIIENEPESVNSDPYGKGWLIKVQCSSPEEKPDLLSSAAYEELVS